MKKNNKLIIKIFIFFIILGFKNIDVLAFQNSYGIITQNDVCPNDVCVPICIYDDLDGLSNISSKDAAILGEMDVSIDKLKDSRQMVGFFYNNIGKGDVSGLIPSSSGWFISFSSIKTDKSKAFGLIPSGIGIPLPSVSYSSSSKLPYDDILANGAAFKDSEMYNKLSLNLDCPAFMSVRGEYDKVRFSDESYTKTQSYHPGISGVFADDDSYKSYKLQYNFKGEVEEIIERTLPEISWRYSMLQHLPTEAVNIKRLNFVIELENNTTSGGYSQKHGGEKMDIKIESNARPSKETLDKYCPYFKEVIEKDKGVEYSVKLKNYYQGTYLTKIKDALQMYASGSAKNPTLYEYETLYKILVYKENNENKYRIDKFKDFENLLNDDISDSLKYLSELCTDNGYEISYDKDKASSALADNPLYTYVDPKIDFSDEYSCSILSDFADVISTGYFIIEMIGLAILIVLSSMDYLKIFLNDNSDELKKANGNLAKRLGIVVVLFLLPAFINVLFSIFKIEGVNSEHPLCVQISNK